MQLLGKYMISVTAAAILCSSCRTFLKGSTVNSSVVRMLTGVFMIITVLSPFLKLEKDDWKRYMDHFQLEASHYSSDGKVQFERERNAIIKGKLEAYILDKAAARGANLSADIALSEDTPPIPEAITIKGAVSPLVKSELEECISSQLGISKEKQTWVQYPSQIK